MPVRLLLALALLAGPGCARRDAADRTADAFTWQPQVPTLDAPAEPAAPSELYVPDAPDVDVPAPLPVPDASPAVNPWGGEASPAPGDRFVRFRAVGDVMLGTDYPSDVYLPPDGGAGVLAALAPVLRGAHLTIANLEGPLTDTTAASGKCRKGATACYAFRSPTAYAQHLAGAGVDLASLANNHALDFGEAGRASTERALDGVGIRHSGRPGRYASVRTNGQRVAFAAFHPAAHSNNLLDIDGAAAFVEALARTHDLVVVSFHGGAEGGALRVPHGPETFLGERRGDLRRFAHAVVDAGADLVVGHGPHVPRGLEGYRGRLIAYSLGNFATYGRFPLVGALGLAPVLDVTLAPDGQFAAGQILSARQIGQGVPVPDPSGSAAALVRSLSAADFPDSELVLARDGTIHRR